MTPSSILIPVCSNVSSLKQCPTSTPSISRPKSSGSCAHTCLTFSSKLTLHFNSYRTRSFSRSTCWIGIARGEWCTSDITSLWAAPRCSSLQNSETGKSACRRCGSSGQCAAPSTMKRCSHRWNGTCYKHWTGQSDTRPWIASYSLPCPKYPTTQRLST